MQKLRLQNTYNPNTKSFDRNQFELRESDGTISGKVNISSKKDDKWISKPLPFVAFKSKIDSETSNALLNSRGEIFEAEFNLVVDSFVSKDGEVINYLKMVINKAKCDNATQAPVQQDNDDDFPDF